MPFGNYAVRVAPGPDRKKWTGKIHTTARAALANARVLAKADKGQVCVFNLSKWGARPVCLAANPVRASHRPYSKRSIIRVPYTDAPSKVDFRTGPKMKRLRPGGQSPALDGLRRRRRSRR